MFVCTLITNEMVTIGHGQKNIFAAGLIIADDRGIIVNAMLLTFCKPKLGNSSLIRHGIHAPWCSENLELLLDDTYQNDKIISNPKLVMN
ncbi:MAG: hypothetical protein ABI723_14550 [Bacteroidia bacterium]